MLDSAENLTPTIIATLILIVMLLYSLILNYICMQNFLLFHMTIGGAFLLRLSSSPVNAVTGFSTSPFNHSLSLKEKLRKHNISALFSMISVLCKNICS